jgi:hypothetical protein
MDLSHRVRFPHQCLSAGRAGRVGQHVDALAGGVWAMVRLSPGLPVAARLGMVPV